jgi:hypothetical protein
MDPFKYNYLLWRIKIQIKTLRKKKKRLRGRPGFTSLNKKLFQLS